MPMRAWTSAVDAELARQLGGGQDGGMPAWTSKMAKIMGLYSLFWDIGPLFLALLEVQVDLVSLLVKSGTS